jgi:sialate O-acetylesterase
VSADVRNTGRRAGDEVVQFYVQHIGSAVSRPLKELKDYTRVALRPGERKTVSFALPARQLAYWDSTSQKWAVENDRVHVMLGASSADIRLSDTITVMSGTQESLRLPRIFQDGVVLQRGGPIPVWGWATPNAVVTIAMNGRRARATADAKGEWSTQLMPMQAGGPHTLDVESSGARVTIRDVLIGDVWVASGQSNMEWPLVGSTNGAAAVVTANDPQIREYAVPHTFSETPQSDLAGGKWTAATPQQAGRFSAVGYFFARDLRAATRVPIGIIHTSWGGANIETWMSRQANHIDDAQWNAFQQRERARVQATRDSLSARIGSLPTADAGLVAGRALWADPLLDDSDWKPIQVPALWESAGYNGMDGIGWYRTTFTLTEAEARAGVRLALGTIDDDDITWVNGTRVGNTNGYAQRRLYDVPATALKAGSNVLAVRVADGGGGGGPYGTANQFFVEAGEARHALAGTWKFKVGVVSFQPDGQRINKIPTVLYNQMLHPLQRFAIKGVIWYQGESNANNNAQAAAYRPLFAELIQSWRREWTGSARDFPFLWVQLPNFGRVELIPPDQAGWALTRVADRRADIAQHSAGRHDRCW